MKHEDKNWFRLHKENDLSQNTMLLLMHIPQCTHIATLQFKHKQFVKEIVKSLNQTICTGVYKLGHPLYT